MKTFKRSSLPENIKYNGKILKFDSVNSGIANAGKLHSYIINELKRAKKTVCIVEVLNTRLKGKTDLHGRPYTSNRFIFTS